MNEWSNLWFEEQQKYQPNIVEEKLGFTKVKTKKSYSDSLGDASDRFL